MEDTPNFVIDESNYHWKYQRKSSCFTSILLLLFMLRSLCASVITRNYRVVFSLYYDRDARITATTTEEYLFE